MDFPIVWRPTANADSAPRRFMDLHGIATYDDLLRRSEDVNWFWDAFIKFAGVEFYEPYTQVVDLTRGLPFPKWFINGKINVAHNTLDKWALNPSTAERRALVWEGEDGATRTYTYGDLYAEANQVANALTGLGIQRGDRVAIYMPSIPETVIALFGIYKIGAVSVPLFSGFGADALALRLADVEAKAVITADGFYRGGKAILMKSVLDKALENLPGITTVLVAERLGECKLTPERDHQWSAIIPRQSAHFDTVHTDAEEICMVSYSSGTSGKPKGIVHVHGGVSVKAAEVGCLNYDMHTDDLLYQITDFGWMMGQAPMLRGFPYGAGLLLYEGALSYPDAGRMFRMIEQHHITVFGAPATALRILKTEIANPAEQFDLSSIRLLTHTGEPIDADTWMWYFGWGKQQIPIMNVSGGTEVFAELLSSTAMQPLKATCLGLTPAISPFIVDENGQPVPPGAQGYLGFKLPQPAQTRGFWKESETRYLETYFPHGQHFWWHGDMVEVDSEGFWFHKGRADDVIKISGRRTGPGEIEDIIAQMPEVLESAVIGVPHPVKGEDIIGFVVPKPGSMIAAQTVRTHVAKALGKPYEPGAVYIVPDLPRTRSSKVIRRLIKQRYLGQKLGDTSSLVNPESLEQLPVRTPSEGVPE